MIIIVMDAKLDHRTEFVSIDEEYKTYFDRPTLLAALFPSPYTNEIQFC